MKVLPHRTNQDWVTKGRNVRSATLCLIRIIAGIVLTRDIFSDQIYFTALYLPSYLLTALYGEDVWKSIRRHRAQHFGRRGTDSPGVLLNSDFGNPHEGSPDETFGMKLWLLLARWAFLCVWLPTGRSRSSLSYYVYFNHSCVCVICIPFLHMQSEAAIGWIEIDFFVNFWW